MPDNLADIPVDDLHDPAEPFDAGQWAMHGLLSTFYDLEAGRTCPAVSDLWRQATEGQPLDPHKAHVQDCPRCQKHLLFIRRELEAVSIATTGRSIKATWPLITAGLAMAACLMLLVVIFPSQTSPGGSYDSQIASAFEVIDAYGESELRGGQADEGSPRGVHDEWLKGLLSDREAVRALAERGIYEPRLHGQYHAGHLQIENNRMVLAPGIDKQSATGQQLIDLLEQDNNACERTVSALIRHIPGASERNRADLRRALDRWRVREVFGRED